MLLGDRKMYRNTYTQPLITTPSYLYVPQPYLTLFVFERLQALGTTTVTRGNISPYQTPTTNFTSVYFFKKLVTNKTTENSHHGCISELCIVKFYCQETMFPNFNVYFSRNGYRILYTKFSL